MTNNFSRNASHVRVSLASLQPSVVVCSVAQGSVSSLSDGRRTLPRLTAFNLCTLNCSRVLADHSSETEDGSKVASYPDSIWIVVSYEDQSLIEDLQIFSLDL